MMMRRRLVFEVLAAGMLLAGAALGGEPAPRFTQTPRATRVGDGIRIEFAVSAMTDVAVYIDDANGKIVRHLVAGVLGTNPPAPLKADSLEQSILWDGKDDDGKPVIGPALKVRVGLGLKAKFDRILGGDPNTLDVMRGLAVGPDGELFVLNAARHLHRGFGSTVCNVFDREAKYRRTIMPYRAECFPDKVKEFGILDLGEKGRYPWLHANHLKSIYPFSGQPAHQQPVVLPDGRFILTMRVRGKGAVLVAVDAQDGGAPESGAFGPAFGKEMSGRACLAVAPDGETIYISGTASPKQWKHAVYRAKWGQKTLTPFIGKPEEAGKGDKGLNSPQGIALDRDGNIYVADRGNNRVAIFNPKGKFLSDLPVEDPYMLGVHRGNGAIYVLGGGDPPDHIVKFSSREDPQPVYSRKIPKILRALKGKKRTDSYPVFALDGSDKEPVLWVGSSTAWEAFQLFRFVESNGKLGAPEEKGKGPGFRDCREIQVDRKREEVYFHQGGGVAERGGRFVKINGFDGKVLKSLTGRRSGAIGSHFALGHDGYVYVVRGIAKRIHRYDRDLKPAPFPGRDTNISDKIPGHIYSNHIMGRGLAVRHDGTLYLLHENLPQVHVRYGVSEWGPDGKMKKANLIGSLSQGALSLRIDPAGNLYVGDPLKPAGQLVPPDLQGKVDTARKRQVDNHYPIMYGSILKFPPGGGAGIGPAVEGGRKGVLAYNVPVGVKDDLWQYFGVGPIPATHGPYNHYVSACSCEGLRFDVDGYGRVFAPDAARFRVVVLDTNGNEIGAFGHYGNQDSAGPGSAMPTPEIPFAWPTAVGVSDRAAYVSDILSRRIVRVKLTCAAEEACEIR